MTINNDQINQANRQEYQARIAQRQQETQAQPKATKEVKPEQPAATYEKSTEQKSAGTYQKPQPKGLSTEQINALRDSFEQQENSWISQMTQASANNQSNQYILSQLSTEGGLNNLFSQQMQDNLTSVFGSLEAAVPELATTPEGAAAAIAEGGAYSVENVADRLFTFAEEMTGGDPEKMEEMKEAVKQGFKEAGMDLETGAGMPDITFDTYEATMKKFDDYIASKQEPETDPILPNDSYPTPEVQATLGMQF
ncbi:hypothetical protein AN641_03040 [Candidatus Epulonipiscioides gigas]|nr:hypothetical protein AN641_03040 [Epulopiscium sp. SCG-C07WGA-EpuloA2]